MTYTMPTEYRLYIDKIQKTTPEEILFGTFEENKDYWRNLFAKWDRDVVKDFNELLSQATRLRQDIISVVETDILTPE